MEIVILTESEALDLVATLAGFRNEHGLHTLRFAVDGGLKVKINSGTWSPPLGRIADAGGY